MDWFVLVSLLVGLFAAGGIVEAIRTGTARLGLVELDREFEPSSFWGAVCFMGFICIVAVVAAWVIWQNPFG